MNDEKDTDVSEGNRPENDKETTITREKKKKRNSKETEEVDEKEESEDEKTSLSEDRNGSAIIPMDFDDEAVDVSDGKDKNKRQTDTYAAKKTVAQGMMDIALITANANQLRYLVEFNRNSSTFHINVFLITVSLLLQVAVGVSLIFKGRMDFRGQSRHRNAKRINNYVVVGVFMVTVINVFVASFTVTGGGAGVVSSTSTK